MRAVQRVTRLAAWVATQYVVQLGLLAYFLLFGSFAYLGRSDSRSMQVAMKLFSNELSSLIVRMWATDGLVLCLWSLPLAVAFVGFRSRWRRPGWGLFVAASLCAYFGWFGLAAMKSPSLLSGALYGDGVGVVPSLMIAVCSKQGPFLLGGLLVLGSLALARLVNRALGLFTLVFYVVVISTLWTFEAPTQKLSLKAGSVVLLVTDSLRSDRFTPEALPRLFAVAEAAGRTTVPEVVPPLARTTPAVISLLTGRLPGETHVTTMFSNTETFAQTPSIISAYKDAGFCTVAVGEYPAEMLSRYQLGFEFVDVPLSRFKEISLQAVLSNDPFILSVESYALLRRALGAELRDLVIGLPLMAAPRELVHRFATAVERCKDRPVFAFVFADQPHYPYAQTWPYYLAKGADYRGRFKFAKDDTSAGALTTDEKQHIRDLYDTSLLSTDGAFGSLAEHLQRNGQLDHSTVIITGDHGESLYDGLGIVGHGDQLGEMEGIMVPWVVLGKGRKQFEGLPARVQSTVLAERLGAINGVAYPHATAVLPAGSIYVETDMWMAETPNVPASRVHYPELSGILTIQDGESDIEVDREFLPTVEFAKHRVWMIDGHQWALKPNGHDVLATRDGAPVDVATFPIEVRDFLFRFYPEVAPALLH